MLGFGRIKVSIQGLAAQKDRLTHDTMAQRGGIRPLGDEQKNRPATLDWIDILLTLAAND